ncbi:hypothetical protein [Pseudoalteromonas sp. Z9A5]|jgi:hypothetical protein|uniref:hypothetical protein n=1 Tax=Pseudoalteromonas sp. Z9A5 TaxID=2686355 RepID=UPI00140E47CD|nr:hypothetical protein [Pseudoalteromonas sp. Z9A5]
MTDNFRVIFAGLADDVDAKTACTTLAQRLKTSEEKVTLFFKGKPLFAPSNKDKALKQAKLLVGLGIKSKLQAISSASSTNTEQANNQRDERIFDALDYITSSLIRLEEKLEELEQRLPEAESKAQIENNDEWQDDDLMLDEELISAPKKRSNVLLYSLIATVVTLLIVLAAYLAFPNLFSF